MLRRLLLSCCIPFTAVVLLSAGAATAPPGATLSAASIVEKNVAARGGLQNWRAVQAMSLQGKMGAGGNRRSTLATADATLAASKDALAARPVEEVYLPFVMELKRPRKMRLEVQFKGQAAVQVYDGSNGWKLRPFLGRNSVEPFTSDELKIASMQTELDGPLVDYAAKGSRVELLDTEKVEDRDTYKLMLTTKYGQKIQVWVDAQTFLETKIDGQPRRLDGVEHPVEVYFRDYRSVSGLQIPFVLETEVLYVAEAPLGLKAPTVPSEKTLIEKVVVNPKLDEARFSKPLLEMASNAK